MAVCTRIWKEREKSQILMSLSTLLQRDALNLPEGVLFIQLDVE